MTTAAAAKHTPGPWEISSTDLGCIALLEYSPDRIMAVMPVGRLAEPGEREANAKLISQAPALAEALRKIAELDPPCPFPPSDGRYPEWFRVFGQIKTVLRNAGVEL